LPLNRQSPGAVVNGTGMRQKTDCDSFDNAVFDASTSFYVPFRFPGGLYHARNCPIRIGLEL